MKIFKFSRFFDVGGAGRKAIEEADVKGKLTAIVPYLKNKSEEMIKECGILREKLKDIPGTNYDLGVFHMRAGNISDAILRFRMVIFLKPENAMAYYNLGRCLVLSDENEEARKNFQKALERGVLKADVDYMMQKIDNPEQIKTIPVPIIKEKVEMLSERHEAYYMDEEYLGYKTFIKTILANIKDKNPNLDVLDLACRFGSSGQLLKERSITRKITGIDFVGANLEEVKTLKFEGESVYDNLQEKWLGSFLSENKTKFDLILSGHDFEYVGDLKNIATLINSSLNNKGIFALMLEDSSLESGYKLDIYSDKFYYSRSYIKEVLEKSGFVELQIKDFIVSEDDKYLIYIFEKTVAM